MQSFPSSCRHHLILHSSPIKTVKHPLLSPPYESMMTIFAMEQGLGLGMHQLETSSLATFVLLSASKPQNGPEVMQYY